MIVRNKIWEEIKQAKSIVLGISDYNDKHRKVHRRFDLYIAIIAAAGAISYHFDNIIPMISSWVIAFVTFIKGTNPNFLQAEQDLEQLDKLMDFYNLFLTKLEHLFYRLDNSIITEYEAEAELYYLKLDEADKLSKVNRLLISLSKEQENQIITQSNKYFKAVYDYEKNEETL